MCGCLFVYCGSKVCQPFKYSYEFISHTTHTSSIALLLLLYSVKKSFEDGPTLQHTLPPNEKQPFSFITTVSWTFLEPQYETVKSPPPTLIFSVPYDVFYPFQMSNDNYGISNSGSSSRGSIRVRSSSSYNSSLLLSTSLAAFVVAVQHMLFWISVEISIMNELILIYNRLKKWTNTNWETWRTYRAKVWHRC